VLYGLRESNVTGYEKILAYTPGGTRIFGGGARAYMATRTRFGRIVR
jgi:hypothetical protein